MNAHERAWAEGWSIIPGIENPNGQLIYTAIRRWNVEGQRNADYSSSLDIIDDLDELPSWDSVRVGLRGAGSESESLHHSDAHGDEDSDEDADSLNDAIANLDTIRHGLVYGDEHGHADEHKDADGDAFVNGYSDTHIDTDRHRDALARLARAVFYGDKG